MADRLRVCALYPDLMNIYADRGNLQLLQKRCEWRGIGFELTGVGLSESLDPDAHDLFYIGGGQDRDQELCAEDLATVKREALHAAAARGAVIFAVCGGYQLLGHSYELGGAKLPGVGLVDLHTVREDGPRLIGNVAIEVDLGGPAARARGLREPRRPDAPRRHEKPLGRVLKGHGNDGRSGLRGRPQAQRDRHVPARPALAQECVVRGLPDRDGAGSRAVGSRSARRQTRGRGARGSAPSCRNRGARRVASAAPSPGVSS